MRLNRIGCIELFQIEKAPIRVFPAFTRSKIRRYWPILLKKAGFGAALATGREAPPPP